VEKAENDLQVHVFVCTNQKSGKECCARIRINASGCLDRCKEGIAIAIYPQNKWLINVKSSDLEEVQKVIAEILA
jgi:(2Fe-2S) ferredoxin